MDVLIVGGGGREHALAWKIRQSPLVEHVWVAPGNAGIAECATCVPIRSDDTSGLAEFAVQHRVGLVVVGPEGHLRRALPTSFVSGVCWSLAQERRGHGSRGANPSPKGSANGTKSRRLMEFVAKMRGLRWDT
jgi:Phosphoribosylamine-glycine ligase